MKSRSRSDRRVITVRQSQKRAFASGVSDLWSNPMVDPMIDPRHVAHMMRNR